MEWTVSDTGTPNVHTITFDASPKDPDLEAWVLVTSDWHYDNPDCNRKLLYQHLGEAVERNAPVISNGDTFCLMQGKYDPRKSKSKIRPEHMKDDYLDAVISTSVDALRPYSSVLTVFGVGNHESTILKHQETDVLRRFCARYANETGSPHIRKGGYGGYIILRFQKSGQRHAQKVVLKYFHGSGGGGPVTKGVIQTNRRAVYLPDADVIATGHIHEKWSLTTVRERITRTGRIYHSPQLHICSATYKDEYKTGERGWHVERGAPPKPLGGMWLRFTCGREKSGGVDDTRVKVQAMEA